jgi:hypothetical protein
VHVPIGARMIGTSRPRSSHRRVFNIVLLRQVLAGNATVPTSHQRPDTIPLGSWGGDAELSDAFEIACSARRMGQWRGSPRTRQAAVQKCVGRVVTLSGLAKSVGPPVSIYYRPNAKSLR